MHPVIEDILATIQPWAGSRQQALAWFHNQPIHSFGGKTAAELVRDGRIEAVKEHIARIDKGGYS